MGEEPERLRARAEFILASRGKVTDRMGRQSADDVLVLLAEVERLARDNENLARERQERTAELVRSLYGLSDGIVAEGFAHAAAMCEQAEREVERLAGERDEAVRKAQWMEGLGSKEEWERAELWRDKANEFHAECERLAGRVAAAEDLIDRALGTVERAGWTGGKWHRDARAFRDHKRMEV